MLALVAALGFLAGSFAIANTSIGWHLSSGHWILDHHAVPRADPFSTTAEGTPWIDHEWGFQLMLATVERLGGAPLLVLARATLVAALAALLLLFGVRSGLSPPAATVLAVLCLYGARIRFFLRPELATLLLAPAVVWIFLQRREPGDRRWLLAVAALMALGANLHAGILVVPPLLAGLLAAESLQWLWTRRGRNPLGSGALGLAVAAAAPLLNPYGWRLYQVPVEIAHLVGLPHIPNPEWISPTFSDVPPLYVAIGAGLVLLGLGERRFARWALLLMAAVLALRYVRNVGLFFALLPIAVGPALASLPAVGREGATARRPLWRVAAVALAVLVVVSMVAEPGRAPSLGFSERFYPVRALAFIDQQGLAAVPLYNDVRFGGFLIRNAYPQRRAFLDDRNEIHEPLLAEIHSILGSSDPGAWQAMLDRYRVGVALLRYNPPFTVLRPDGRTVGRRGFSALWFPEERWALVYWDDIAMVLVDRTTADPALLERFAYRVVRPDDAEELRARLAADPSLRPIAAAELARKLVEQPDCERALALSEQLLDSLP
jgi:hypothetical protein